MKVAPLFSPFLVQLLPLVPLSLRAAAPAGRVSPGYRYGARKAGVFGSVVRGEMRRRSDVDILVEIGDDLSLLDLVRIDQTTQLDIADKD